MPEIDERLLKTTITIRGEETSFETLDTHAIGMKHTSSLLNSAEITVSNISRDLRQMLLTEGTPFTRLDSESSILIEAGRESTGLTHIYQGDITTVEVTQPPDIGLVIRALTGQHWKGGVIALSQGAQVPFKTIAKDAAEALEIPLDFRAPDQLVSNFSFSGARGKLINKLGDIGQNIDAFVDDEALVIQSRFDPDNKGVTEINLDTGLIGIPEFIDFGIRCRVLIEKGNQDIKLGEDIDLVSEQYPDTDGRYSIYRLSFDLANRDTQFYYTIEAARRDLGKIFSNQ